MIDKYINPSGLSRLRTWILQLLAAKQDKVINPTAGNILVTDANGQAQDSGVGITDKQDTLESGTNIKTVNHQSVLGPGNLDIEVPTNVADLKNDSGYQTKSDVEALIQDELTRFDKLDYDIVDALPDKGVPGVRYLVKHGTDNRYEEFIYTHDGWHDIGATDEVNLEDYYTKDEVDALVAGKADALTFDATPTAGSTNPVTSEGIKAYVDGRDPFMLLDFSQTGNGTLTPCSDDTLPSGLATGRIDINLRQDLQADWAIASLAKFEVKNGSARVPAFPIASFSMNGQIILRVLFKTTGTTSKPFTTISGAILLKHR